MADETWKQRWERLIQGYPSLLDLFRAVVERMDAQEMTDQALEKALDVTRDRLGWHQERLDNLASRAGLCDSVLVRLTKLEGAIGDTPISESIFDRLTLLESRQQRILDSLEVLAHDHGVEGPETVPVSLADLTVDEAMRAGLDFELRPRTPSPEPDPEVESWDFIQHGTLNEVSSHDLLVSERVQVAQKGRCMHPEDCTGDPCSILGSPEEIANLRRELEVAKATIRRLQAGTYIEVASGMGQPGCSGAPIRPPEVDDEVLAAAFQKVYDLASAHSRTEEVMLDMARKAKEVLLG